MLRVRDVAKEIRKQMGCRVLIENPRIRDHASNSYVESTVHRLRQMGTVLQKGLAYRSRPDVMVFRQPLRYLWRDDPF